MGTSTANSNTLKIKDSGLGPSEITIEWIFLEENLLQPTITIFLYINGTLEGFMGKRVVPIHDILKILMLGSATVIRFPAYGL
ncbi:hypothetical protein TESG_08372 [Trichophyton tonsurans CBS 112818]|uniref:Uncharacterized protein n=1 Tax=Trichophyton tonsurans (strain CBS 112818) TaxID=647933 RepID=F2RV76_TRIT1|nr:hypothetical protein TESG_08372 [Trichophyton tonsurans CBS 112818]